MGADELGDVGVGGAEFGGRRRGRGCSPAGGGGVAGILTAAVDRGEKQRGEEERGVEGCLG